MIPLSVMSRTHAVSSCAHAAATSTISPTFGMTRLRLRHLSSDTTTTTTTTTNTNTTTTTRRGYADPLRVAYVTARRIRDVTICLGTGEISSYLRTYHRLDYVLMAMYSA